MSYIGTEPVIRATRVRTFGTLEASGSIIEVPGGFTPGNIEVFVNGDAVLPTDYDDSDGLNLDFSPAVLDSGTDYVIMEARQFETSGFPTLAGGSQADFSAMPQVNGDPIVESGSNVDGEWTRWADGTQISGHFDAAAFTSTDTSATIQGLTIYQEIRIYNHPQSFVSTTSAVASGNQTGAVNESVKADNLTNTDVRLIINSLLDITANNSEAHWIVYGQWK